MKDNRNIDRILEAWQEDPRPFTEDLEQASQEIFENTGLPKPTAEGTAQQPALDEAKLSSVFSYDVDEFTKNLKGALAAKDGKQMATLLGKVGNHAKALSKEMFKLDGDDLDKTATAIGAYLKKTLK